MVARHTIIPITLAVIASNPAAGWSQAWTVSEEAKLTGNASDDDHLGQSVAISGDTAVVGAFGEDTEAGISAGAVHVFVRTGLTWIEQQTLTASDAASSDEFGWSVAISGDTLVIGALRADLPGEPDAGAAYVFVREGAAWTEQGKLTAGEPNSGARFGWAVAVEGDRIAVGAPRGHLSGVESTGKAYVFVRNGTTWTEEQVLFASDPSTNDSFGWSLALAGDFAVVGAPQHAHETGVGSGAAYVFARSGATWSVQQELTGSDVTSFDAFGWSVAMAGDTIVAGAWASGPVGPLLATGAAYVFVRTGAAWTEQQKLLAGDGREGDSFGASAAVEGDVVAIGADTSGLGPGAAYIFSRSGVSWFERAKLVPGDGEAGDGFGKSVALAGDRIVVGAPNLGESNSGSAYVFRSSPVETYCTSGKSASGCQAQLSATGTPSATASSGFTLSAAAVEGAKDGLFFFGTGGKQAVAWGNGTSYQCVVPPVVRAPLMMGTGTNGLCDGSFALDLNALWCPGCPKPAKNPGAGATVQAQLWYRDPFNTGNQTTSLSDALEFGVDP